ncbi:MAG: HAMP domain-containing sensor histidine kinase [Nocardioides sp.]
MKVGWRHSIRSRIAAAMAAVTLVVLVVVGALVLQQAGVDGRERLREQANERLAAAALVYSVNGRLTQGASIAADGPPKALIATLDQVGDQATFFDGSKMWAAERLGPEVVMNVRLDAAPLRDEQTALRQSLLFAGLIAFLAAALLGWWAATGLSRRLRRAAGLAASGEHDLTAVVGGRDEVTALSQAVDEMTAALAARVERERQFGADVAHELRTPLTALVTSAELLPEDESSALVRRQVDRLRRLVEDLLELFRAESGQAEVRREPVDLGVLATDATEQATLVVEDPAVVETDPRRVHLIVSNLVRNAAAHGGQRVTVTVRGASIEVRDDGPGYPEQVLTQGPLRFRRHSGAAGSGLGLAIASAQAELLGARLTLANDDGAVATLTFGDALVGGGSAG